MRYTVPVLVALLGFGCGGPGASLSEKEKKLCDSLQLDPAVIALVRPHTDAELEAFHYSLSRQILADGTEKELDPIHLRGIVFKETVDNRERILAALHTRLKDKGYTLFTLDQNFGIGKKQDVLAILKTTDPIEVLKAVGTDGINFEIDNDSLLNIMKVYNAKYSLDLVGASGDWCEFQITKDPENWLKLAEETYHFCPDIVDQGVGSVEELATEMQSSKRLYFWWD